MPQEAAHRPKVAESFVFAQVKPLHEDLNRDYRELLDANPMNRVDHSLLKQASTGVAVWETELNKEAFNLTSFQGLFAALNLGTSKQALKVVEDIQHGKVYTKDQQINLLKTIPREGTATQIWQAWLEIRAQRYRRPTHWDYGFPSEMFGLKGQQQTQADSSEAPKVQKATTGSSDKPAARREVKAGAEKP